MYLYFLIPPTSLISSAPIVDRRPLALAQTTTEQQTLYLIRRLGQTNQRDARVNAVELLICIDPLSSSDEVNMLSSVNVTITNDGKRSSYAQVRMTCDYTVIHSLTLIDGRTKSSIMTMKHNSVQILCI